MGEHPSGSVFRSVPTSQGVAGNGGVWSAREKPKETPSHPEKPGKGKAGRMNTSEPSMRLRNYVVAGTMADEDGNDGSGTQAHAGMPALRGAVLPRLRTPRPRSIEGILPSRTSLHAERGNPNGVSVVVDTRSKRTVRNAQASSGKTMVQEAKASSRKATGMHNRLDRALPNLKGC